jgi:DDE family transposase
LAVPKISRCAQVAQLLDSPEITRLVADLDATRSTGRPGYPTRALLGACLVKALYGLATWSRTAALVDEHPGLQDALGAAPSVYACYRFAEKLRRHRDLLEGAIEDVIAALREHRPGFGHSLAIDASDLPAYANGQRYVSKGGRERAPEEYSDPDASWGHRSSVSTRKGGGFYGYKVHAVVCTHTELPLAWKVQTARDHEAPFAGELVAAAKARGAAARTCVLDKGYDVGPVYDGLMELECLPIIPLRETPAVKRGDHLLPHDGPPNRLHPVIDRRLPRFRRLFRKRGAVERVYGRLKHEWALLPLRLRGRERVQLHADLTVLCCLASALAKARVHGSVRKPRNPAAR